MTELKVTITFRCCRASGYPNSVEICGKEFKNFFRFWQHHKATKHKHLQIIYGLGNNIGSESVDLE